jgi:lysophospholipase L1-like esterase
MTSKPFLVLVHTAALLVVDAVVPRPASLSWLPAPLWSVPLPASWTSLGLAGRENGDEPGPSDQQAPPQGAHPVGQVEDSDDDDEPTEQALRTGPLPEVSSRSTDSTDSTDDASGAMPGARAPHHDGTSPAEPLPLVAGGASVSTSLAPHDPYSANSASNGSSKGDANGAPVAITIPPSMRASTSTPPITNAASATPMTPMTPTPATTATTGQGRTKNALELPSDLATWLAFLDKVHAVQDGARDKVRVVQLGDSEIAGDRFVSTLRADTAARLGLGGPGFALAAPPWHWYRRAGFATLSSSGFRGRSFVFAKGNDGNFGPGGVAFDAEDDDARIEATLDPSLRSGGCTVELVYGASPAGGVVEIMLDGSVRGVVELAGEEAVRVWRSSVLSPCPQALAARVLRRPARLFGWSVESLHHGIVWTSLGTVGANASALARYGVGRLGQALATLQPDLVVATYGLNLTGHGAAVPRTEGEQLKRLMNEVRALRPDTACLVMSPYPVLVDKDGALTPSTSTKHLATIQRRAAEAAGCVFLDRERFVGGPQKALEWFHQKPRYLSGDYVHLTPEGASFLARSVSRLLLGELFVP